MQSVRQSMAGLNQRKDTDYKKVLNLTFVYTKQIQYPVFPTFTFYRADCSSLSLLSEMVQFHKTPYTRAGKTGSVNYLPMDKNLPHSGGLCKKHKKWRETKVVNFWHSSSGETCSNQSQEGLGLKFVRIADLPKMWQYADTHSFCAICDLRAPFLWA